jgi:hypothetical protein
MQQHPAPTRYLLFGSDKKAMRDQFLKFFSKEDWDANQQMQVGGAGCLDACPLLVAIAVVVRSRWLG